VLANLTQRFTVLSKTRDKEKAVVEASHAEVSSRADDLAITLMQATSYIHSALSLENGPTGKPSEPQLAFHHL